jgi:hypothetical protein
MFLCAVSLKLWSYEFSVNEFVCMPNFLTLISTIDTPTHLIKRQKPKPRRDRRQEQREKLRAAKLNQRKAG